MSRCGPFMVLAVRRVPGRKTHCFWAYVIKLLNGFALFGRTHHPPRKTAQWQSQSEAVTVASCKKKPEFERLVCCFGMTRMAASASSAVSSSTFSSLTRVE